MRRLILLISLFLPTLAYAQWTPVAGGGCFGGSTCGDKRLRVQISDDRPVLSIRFRAHDDIGDKADGRLRVYIDGTLVSGPFDIPRRGQVFTLEVEELRGRTIVFEAASYDEVEVSDIQVVYGRNERRNIPRDRDRDNGDSRGGRGSGGGWRGYPRAGACIGGNECRNNGNRITIALDAAPVIGIRFRAHDNIGARADGKLSVSIDDTTIASYVDVQRNGKLHEFEVDNVRGTRLVIRTSNDDEVEVSDIEVLYGRGGGRHGGDGSAPAETRDEGGCIGGDECGGQRARIRVRLRDYPVDSIRFYARDDVGARAGGKLRIAIDDQVIEYALDITREGKTHEINVKGLEGEYLILSPAEDDEVVLKDIRVRYEHD